MRFDGFDQAVAIVVELLEKRGLTDFYEDNSGDWVMDDNHREAAEEVVLALFPELR